MITNLMILLKGTVSQNLCFSIQLSCKQNTWACLASSVACKARQGSWSQKTIVQIPWHQRGRSCPRILMCKTLFCTRVSWSFSNSENSINFVNWTKKKMMWYSHDCLYIGLLIELASQLENTKCVNPVTGWWKDVLAEVTALLKYKI